MGILEHYEHRPAPRFAFELLQQRLQQLLPFALRTEAEVDAGTRQREQLGQQRNIVVILYSRSEQRPQFAELRFDSIIVDKSGGVFELRNEGKEGAVLMMRRAEIPQAPLPLIRKALQQRFRQPRLADARFTGEQH